MSEAKVLLLNADLSSAAGPQLLQGFSGKTYAVSRWCAAYNCHAIEMTVAEYEACRDDLRRAVHLMMRRWYPKFILPAPPEAVAEFEKGYRAGLAGEQLPEGSTRAAQVGWGMAREAVGDKGPALAAGEERGGEHSVEGGRRSGRARGSRPSPRSRASAAKGAFPSPQLGNERGGNEEVLSS